jgi:hypothetical protein
LGEVEDEKEEGREKGKKGGGESGLGRSNYWATSPMNGHTVAPNNENTGWI